MSTPFKMKGFSGFGSSPAKQEGHRKYSDLEKYDDDRDDQSKEASFRAAFAKARKAQGPGGTFTWEGKKYTTDRKDDKFVMGQETGEIQTDKKGKKYKLLTHGFSWIIIPDSFGDKELKKFHYLWKAVENY